MAATGAELELMADTVAERLRADGTRAATLQALVATPPPVPRELALAAAPALADVVAGTEDREVFDRCCLLVARLLAEASPDSSALYGATLGGERFAAWYKSRVIVEAMQRALGTDSGEGERVTREDAYSSACLHAYAPPGIARGGTSAEAAAGRTMMEGMRIVRDPLRSSRPPAPPAHPRLLAAMLAHMPTCR